MSMTTTFDRPAHPHATATAQVLDGLMLYGWQPEDGEIDPRGFPEPDTLADIVAGVFAAVTEPLRDTSLETDLTDLLWSLTNLFHKKAERVEQLLDDNESRQRDAQAQQDGSEVASTNLERLIAQGRQLVERRDTYERLRDLACSEFEAATGMPWRPRSGSVVNHKHLTASMIDSRDFLAAKRQASQTVLIPQGTKIAFTGGVDCNDHEAIWAVLDKVIAKHQDMVLLHGGANRGAERIASAWAVARKVTQIAFQPDWNRDRKAAPFKRNDRMLDTVPVGLVAFPGGGITDNLVDKARALGIPVCDQRQPA